jgi:polyisoprenoid-binding protein YceI
MKRFTKGIIFGSVVIGAIGLMGFNHRVAAIKQFELQDGKGANGISFGMLDGLEPLVGTGNDVRGTVILNMDEPAKSSGKVIIGIKALKVTSEVMSGNMMGEWCLDADKFPEAMFVVKSAKITKNDKKKMEMIGEVTGDFTAKGVTKEIKVPVVAKYVPGGIKERFGEAEGDLLMIKANFSFNRFDYNIGKAVKEQLLSNKVDVRLNIAGMAFKGK